VKIELTKEITVKKIEFIGEVNFFEESPYIELLKNFSTKKELIKELEEKNLTHSAINNIIGKLEKLGVIEDGDIVNIEEGFPEKEYGKYSLELFENDTSLPFKLKNREITRESVNGYSNNRDIKQDRYLIDKIHKESKNFSDDKKFQIIRIESSKYRETSSKKIELRLNFIDEKWEYIIENRKFSMDGIDLNNLFLGEWDNNFQALKVQYNWIENDSVAKNDFMLTFPIKKHEIKNFGIFKANFQNIPIVPKNKSDALKWLLYLIVNEIEKLNRYISKDELHWIWNNILDEKPQLESFDLKFSFEEVLKKFGHGSKYYWLLQSGIDLYPFDTNLTPKERVIINTKNPINLNTDFVRKFNINMPKELIIIDRWIITLEQFQGLEMILKAFKHPQITIITQEEYTNRKKDKYSQEILRIKNILRDNNIKRVIKKNKEIVHSRYWIFDNKKFYKTNNSLDVLKIDGENISMKEQTTFDLYEQEDLEPELTRLLEEL